VADKSHNPKFWNSQRRCAFSTLFFDAAVPARDKDTAERISNTNLSRAMTAANDRGLAAMPGF
jgi:hypothetical protein